MPPPLTAAFLLIAAYLIGALPFGYIVGRLRGVNLFAAGSGNIGATNAARVLGAKFGVLVFGLDLLKGAAPCAFIVPLAHAFNSSEALPDEGLRVGAAALAFLGHLFPIYLGFRGGKGVATGAGTILVLAPGPAVLAILTWIVVLLASRMVSLASLAAVLALVGAYLLAVPNAFGAEKWPVAAYLIAGAAMVFVKHRSNIRRLIRGAESTIREFTMRMTILRALHVLALGFWFGGAGFFNFVAAPAIFESFKQVVNGGPSDRTANQVIFSPPVSSKDEEKAKLANSLASALAGSAVGPIFPLYFAMQAVCGLIALVTAASWWKLGGVHRLRVCLLAAAIFTVAVGWPLSNYVSELRLLRFNPDSAVANAAKAAFGPWHLASLLLSFITVCLAGASLALAARLPNQTCGGSTSGTT